MAPFLCPGHAERRVSVLSTALQSSSLFPLAQIPSRRIFLAGYLGTLLPNRASAPAVRFYP